MIDFFVRLLLSLNNIFGNLGLTIIFIGIMSRLIFHPLFASSLRYSNALRDMKPKLDEVKKKHKGDNVKLAAAQSKLFKEAGVNPAAGALGCLSLIIQLIVFFLLFQSLRKVISSGIETDFLLWDLGRPDAYRFQGFPLPIPGVLVWLTAVATFIQSRMILPQKAPEKKKKGGGDFADALASSQSQTAYFIPLIILYSGTQFVSGLALYWLVSTLFGIIQQYIIIGPGGLQPWLKALKIIK